MALATTTILLFAAFVSSVSGSCVGDVDETSLVQLKASVRHASERVVGDNATKDSKDTAKKSKTNSSDKNGTTNSSDDAEDMQITLNTTLKKKNKASKHALHEAAHTVDELTATLKVSGVTKDGDIAKENMIHKLEVVMGHLDHMSSHAAQHAAEKLSEVVEHLEEEGEDVSETLKYAEHHLPEAPLGQHGGYKLNGTLANVSVKFQSPNVSNLTTMKISSLPHDATNYHKGANWPCEYPSMCDDDKKFTAEETEEVDKAEEAVEKTEEAVEKTDGENSSAHRAWFATTICFLAAGLSLY